MTTSQSGLLALTYFEEERLKAYQDEGGVWTIGVGHTAAAGPPVPVAGMEITHAEEQTMLARDIVQYEKEVDTHLAKLGAKNVPQHVYDGMVSFCYNLGGGSFDTASWVASWVKGSMVAAEAQLKQWDKVRKSGALVTSPGLARRRAEEADMIFRDKYPSGITSPDVSGTTVPPPTAVKPDPTSQQVSHNELLDWLKNLVEEMFPSLASWIGKL